ncbi:MAG: DUF4058 family protein, partial [Stigonema ocellatum SAG 48.90 = DSM 106950]|nr:DUF4058 family protein [Stigonema ocellatum SAG 48.90 = DSM 106950]
LIGNSSSTPFSHLPMASIIQGRNRRCSSFLPHFTSCKCGAPDGLAESNLGGAPTTQSVEVLLPLPEILTEAYLEIRAVETEEVVTIIEVLSPKNKQVGIGRLQYETKRLKILGSATHFVEIDLLRQGNSMAMVGNFGQTHYRIVVSHRETRPKAQLYGFNLQDRIPEFPVPLRTGELEPTLDLKSLLDQIYDQGSYDLRIDYSRPPIPALSEPDMAWLNEILQQFRGVRV